jgi:hypothetical protein
MAEAGAKSKPRLRPSFDKMHELGHKAFMVGYSRLRAKPKPAFLDSARSKTAWIYCGKNSCRRTVPSR